MEVVFVFMVWFLFTLGYYLHSRDLRRESFLNATDEEKKDEKVIHVEIVEVLSEEESS